MRNLEPLVSVVAPCRNERQHIRTFVQAMLAQERPDGGFELIVADGDSTDGTAEILRELAAQHPSLRVIHNPGRIVSTGLNGAVAVASGSIIVRADVHSEYADDYLRQCVSVLGSSGADNVGGPWVAASKGYLGSAIAAGFQSRFGSGGAKAHDPEYEGPVDTVYLGCWRRECLERFPFDEELVRNQDDELNLRLSRAGGIIWQSPRIRSWYHPRGSLRRLFQQYAQYGYWKVRVIQKHRLPASWRHVAPGLFVLALVTLLVASLVSTVAAWALVALVAVYLACSFAASVAAAARTDLKLLPVLPFVFSCFHIGYGYGFLLGVLHFGVLRRAPVARMSTLTRTP